MDICLSFDVHQPFRLNRNIDIDMLKHPYASYEELFHLYFDHQLNEEIFHRVARRCYEPVNEIILEQIERFKDRGRMFKVSFNISGVFLEQCRKWAPRLLESFDKLVKSGCVELLGQTYYHSLSSLYEEADEFIEQAKLHKKLLNEIFNYEPKVFENTELIFNNKIGRIVEELGYKALITEGAERTLGWRSSNYVYKAHGSSILILTRNHRLSDDIGFRFSSRQWEHWPLTTEKYASWLAATPGQCITICLDYETFGEHHWPETGIHEFLKQLPLEVFKHKNLSFSLPSEVIESHPPVDELNVDESSTISWADLERDTSAWLGNPLQNLCFSMVKGLRSIVDNIGSQEPLKLWRYLQTSDHFYYMSMKGGGAGDVHSYFSPYRSPIEAFTIFIRILTDFERRVLNELTKIGKADIGALRKVSLNKAFSFYYEFARPTGIAARSLNELINAINIVDLRCLEFHLTRGDFERWIKEVIGDEETASKLKELAGKGIVGEKLRKEISTLLKNRWRASRSQQAKNTAEGEE